MINHLGKVITKDVIKGYTSFCGKQSILQCARNATKPIESELTLKSLLGDTFNKTCSLDINEIFYRENKDLLKSLVKDKTGKLIYREPDITKTIEISKEDIPLYKSYSIRGDKIYTKKFISKGESKTLNLDEVIRPLDEDLGILEHGTTDEAYELIKKNGFVVDKKKFAETFQGVYLTRAKDGANTYGSKRISCILNGKTAVGDANIISDFLYKEGPIDDYLKKNNLTHLNAKALKDLLLKEEFTSRGYKAFYSDKVAMFAKCKPIVVFNPNDLIIL